MALSREFSGSSWHLSSMRWALGWSPPSSNKTDLFDWIVPQACNMFQEGAPHFSPSAGASQFFLSPFLLVCLPSLWRPNCLSLLSFALSCICPQLVWGVWRLGGNRRKALEGQSPPTWPLQNASRGITWAHPQGLLPTVFFLTSSSRAPSAQPFLSLHHMPGMAGKCLFWPWQEKDGDESCQGSSLSAHMRWLWLGSFFIYPSCILWGTEITRDEGKGL